jgi:alanine racemase/UDP-N-acetylmuramoyl-tripeptide--D-alanyl-D-alanine ligase
MENLTLGKLAAIVKGRLSPDFPGQQGVSSISIDSRRIPGGSVFFALKGTQFDGHEFVGDAAAAGAVAAVVSKEWFEKRAPHPVASSGPSSNQPGDVALVAVDSPLEALQLVAGWWRSELQGKVVAITGSNGKTIVKDALIQLLSSTYSSSGSPDSFNSQIGVPLSIIRTARQVEYAVFEAGISAPGDMERLEAILRPDFGILTNVGFAHIASFGSREAIGREKANLFRRIPDGGWVLVPSNEPSVERDIESLACRVYRFGAPSDELPFIEHHQFVNDRSRLVMRFPGGESITVTLATPSLEIVTDINIAASAAYVLGVNADTIAAVLAEYTPPGTRMEIWRSPAGFTLINDTCSSDPLSVKAALKSLASLKQDLGKKIFVFGGMRELGAHEVEEHAGVGRLAAQSEVDTLVLVGQNGAAATARAFTDAAPWAEVLKCSGPEDVKKRLLPALQWGDTVLVKGPRNMGIARVAREIMEAMAPSRLIIDLEAVAENITRFKRVVGPDTRILAMVKALAYGSEATRLSIELQRIGVDCFGVASADEGGALRRAGVDLPILVMMWTPEEAEKVIRHRLTPVIYSLEVIEALAAAAREQGRVVEVHLEVDTGMGRLGVMPEQAPQLARAIAAAGSLRLTGMMTHFACADDPSQDEFTGLQISRFRTTIAELEDFGFTGLLLHAGATAGAVRFPPARLDMVRIGVGMYGIYPSAAVEAGIDLELAVSLVSRVVEIRVFRKGDRIGYGGTFVVPRDDFRVGVVPMGYHDGIPLALSNCGSVLVNGKTAGIIGRISMDSMMIDLSAAPEVEPRADVLIYGRYGGYMVRPEDVALTSNTIPYELLARLGPRVQRIFIRD